MDEIILTNEQKCALFELALIIAENNAKEQDAVKGYTEQLRCIHKAKLACGSIPFIMEKLEALEAATEEKTADELSHSKSLNLEYSAFTDIQPKED